MAYFIISANNVWVTVEMTTNKDISHQPESVFDLFIQISICG